MSSESVATVVQPDGVGTDAGLARTWLGSEVVDGALEAVRSGASTDLATALQAAGRVTESQAVRLRAQPRVQLIDQFELLSALGSGAMGEVHLARELGTGCLAALKVVTARFEDNQAFQRRFDREGRLLEGLDHPNIARCLGRGVVNDRAWIAMEYVRGPDLGETLRRHGPLPAALAVGFAIQAAAGIEHAWSRAQLVHRDLKPGNLLLERGGRDPAGPPTADDVVKIIDFGLAKAERAAGSGASQLTMTGMVMGTPAYMSPEQVESRDCDCRSDLYSLGATLYHLLTGRLPYEGRTPVEIMARHLNHPVPDPAKLIPDLDPAISALVTTAMAKDPRRRHQDPAAFIAAARAAVRHHHGSSSSTVKRVQRGVPAVPPAPEPRITPPAAGGTARITPLRAPARPAPAPDRSASRALSVVYTDRVVRRPATERHERTVRTAGRPGFVDLLVRFGPIIAALLLAAVAAVAVLARR